MKASRKIAPIKTCVQIQAADNMTESSTTACSRCREQKVRCEDTTARFGLDIGPEQPQEPELTRLQVKCGKELPRCARCFRVDAECVFPEPPDRKLLATYRSSYGTHSKKRKTSEASSAASTAPPSSFTALLNAAEGALDIEKGSCADINRQLSRTLKQFLIDVYFTHMYNAWLLFHRPTLTADIEVGLVPAHVLVSIYATATMYVRPPCLCTFQTNKFRFLPCGSPLARKNASLLHSLGDLQSLGQQWATQAGKEALPEVVDPTIASIQTCQVLALFWFSVGHSRSNTMFSGELAT
jgi:hypothetical protein